MSTAVSRNAGGLSGVTRRLLAYPVSVNGGGEFISAGIDDVTADLDGADVRYYQLNGVLIKSPQPGQITIISRGSSSVKQLID